MVEHIICCYVIILLWFDNQLSLYCLNDIKLLGIGKALKVFEMVYFVTGKSCVTMISIGRYEAKMWR